MTERKRKRTREPQFELLRIVAMLMVITLHYLNWGGLLGAPTGSRLTEAGVWYLEALSVVSVNIYVMISGYFMMDSRFQLRKLLILWCEVFFYSVGIALICALCGVVPWRELWNLFDIQYYCLPIINQHYWFATSYLLLYILSPILNAGVKQLDQKTHGILLLLLLLFYTAVKSLLPVRVALEDYGYSLPWFIVLYVLASYIRRYGIAFLEKHRWRSLLCYLSSAACIVALGYLLAKYGTRYGESGDMRAIPYRYNFLLVVLASVGLFYFFKELRWRDNILTRCVVKLAPYTFGVYLIHEHLLIRSRWSEWLRLKESYGALRIVHYIAVVLGIYLFGTLVDLLRSLLFDVAERLIVWGWGIYLKNREIFDYLIVGFATTVVSIIAYAIFTKAVFGAWEETLRVFAATAASWVVSVIFAYIFNRGFVFHSKKTGFVEVGKEFLSFVAARLFSLCVDEGIMFLLVTVLHFNEFISKYVIDSIVVIVLNYVLSKLFIFKKKDSREPATKQGE